MNHSGANNNGRAGGPESPGRDRIPAAAISNPQDGDCVQGPAADVPVAEPVATVRRVAARFGSLLVTLLSGGIAAALTRAFDALLAEYLVLAAYLTVALGLPEAVNGQSLNGALSRGNGSAPESLFRVYLAALGEGLGLAWTVVASLFGLAVCLGTEVRVAGCIAFAVGGALCLANVYGLLVPRLLNHWRLNATVIGPPPGPGADGHHHAHAVLQPDSAGASVATAASRPLLARCAAGRCPAEERRRFRPGSRRGRGLPPAGPGGRARARGGSPPARASRASHSHRAGRRGTSSRASRRGRRSRR